MPTLKQSRQLHGLTQVGLAESAGVSQPIISYLEAGRRLPKPKTKKAIEKILGKIDWIETRMQSPISTGFGEDEAAEEDIIRAIYIYVKSGQHSEQNDRFKFIKQFIKRFEKALADEQKAQDAKLENRRKK